MSNPGSLQRSDIFQHEIILLSPTLRCLGPTSSVGLNPQEDVIVNPEFSHVVPGIPGSPWLGRTQRRSHADAFEDPRRNGSPQVGPESGPRGVGVAGLVIGPEGGQARIIGFEWEFTSMGFLDSLIPSCKRLHGRGKNRP